MIDIDRIQYDITDSLCSSKLKDLSIDISEMSIDALMNDGLLKQIPVIKTILAIIETTQNLSNYLFLKKILAFLTNVKGVSAKKRKKMIEVIDSNDEYKGKVGETVLEILDKCDSAKKAAYMGVWFSAFLKGKITYGMFLCGANILEHVFLSDFQYFIEQDEDWMMVEDAYEEIAAGLYYIDFTTAFWDIRDVAAGIMSPEEVGDAGAKITPIGAALRAVFNPYYQEPDSYPDPMLDGLFRRYRADRKNMKKNVEK